MTSKPDDPTSHRLREILGLSHGTPKRRERASAPPAADRGQVDPRDPASHCDPGLDRQIE